DEAAEPERERGKRELLGHIELERQPRVLTALDGLAQPPRVPAARHPRQLGGAVGGQDRGLGTFLGAHEVPERERRELQSEVEDLGAGPSAVAFRGLVELAPERAAVAAAGPPLDPLAG